MKLGKLKKLDLRSQWPHEALHFTRWLAEPENLELLGDELGIGIKLQQIEASVGKFSVDILAQEENSDRRIIIENQLGQTDHQHLGQLLTYAAGLEATYVLWIVKDVRDEHRQAMEWLNERTDEHVNFFLVQVELWQIADSPPAPKFQVIVRPNDWVKSVRSDASDGELTDTKTRQLEFWQGLRDFSKSQSEINLRKPQPQHWYDVAIGRSDRYLTFTLNSREKMLGSEIYIPDDKAAFEKLEKHKAEIETELGLGELSWQPLPGKKACRVRLFRPFDDGTDNWEEGYAWLIATGQKLKRMFARDWE